MREKMHEEFALCGELTVCMYGTASLLALRLLGVLRLWRVVRLVDTLVERERRAHDATRDALEREQLVRLMPWSVVILVVW